MTGQRSATEETDDGAPTDSALERAWIELCATVWLDVNWSEYDRYKTRRTTVFNERLLRAKSQQGPEEALDKLCRGFGLAGADFPVEPLETLRVDPRRSMRVFRQNQQYIASKTRQTVDNFYDAQRDDGQDEADPDSDTTSLADFVDTEA
jgi:hypothetical protein